MQMQMQRAQQLQRLPAACGPLRMAKASRKPLVTRAIVEPAIAISGSTLSLLVLGRFVFGPYQRRRMAMEDAKMAEVSPTYKKGGDNYFDNLQKPTSFIAKTGDPSGFGFIDVMGWGALGHVFGYLILACNSLQAAGFDPVPR